MSHGVVPRFTTWCPEPTTPLGKLNPDGASLEYHLRLLEIYRDTLLSFRLPPPSRLRRSRSRQSGVFS